MGDFSLEFDIEFFESHNLIHNLSILRLILIGLQIGPKYLFLDLQFFQPQMQFLILPQYLCGDMSGHDFLLIVFGPGTLTLLYSAAIGSLPLIPLF